MTDRLNREFARQVIQQEKMPATSNNKTRLDNIRGLELLHRQLERVVRQQGAGAARKANKNARNPQLALQTLERRLFAMLEFRGETEIHEESER